MDNERGRWKIERDPRLEPVPFVVVMFGTATGIPAFDIFLLFSALLPSTEITSSNVVDWKLTLRDGFTDVVDDVSSPDISAL